ncbi:MAG: nitrous oxide reductase accessory protein NosL [Desulfurivibrionaceae bacterium]|nr:nitrous oxide reductase accessory protein NosL [Pseudomonadota bacterium]MCG2824057.1 nitrous oxide reductase accessory protein NosL [Desulfobulbaceae bacterium]MDP2003186.1 nitrous oxide reductase accessory protein NosL [Desulfurivibrionaceae bacterium]MDP2756544.1 nitrous oxide reductase accessory protein NosL [Desulfurivibrionaceae bacterium]
MRKYALIICVFSFLLPAQPLLAQPAKEISPQERCPVCGMFVAKHPDWLTQVRLSNGTVKFFDGVKDMMAFTLNPASFGVPGQAAKELWVKDYYTLAWLDGRSAWYVLGSDVYGPMGLEFIPFGSVAAAENFRKDHKGTRVIRFDEITEPLVQSMRHGQKMR